MTPIAISDVVRQRQGWASGYDVRALFVQSGARAYDVWAEVVGEPWLTRLPSTPGQRVVGRTFTTYDEAEAWYGRLVASMQEAETGQIVEPVSAY